MFEFQMLSSSELDPYLEQFHIYGHGLANGLEPEEHLRRLRAECNGLIGLLIFKNKVPVAMITMLPRLSEDIHFCGAGLCCVHFAGSGLGFRGVRALHNALSTIAKDSGANWYSISSRVSKYEYRNKYYQVR